MLILRLHRDDRGLDLLGRAERGGARPLASTGQAASEKPALIAHAAAWARFRTPILA